MAMRVISVRPEMVMSVGMRDRMRMDVAPVKMSEGVLVRQRRGCLAIPGVQKRENRNADARAKVEKRGHGSRPHVPQQHL